MQYGQPQDTARSQQVFDRARGLAQMAIALNTMGYAQLANRAIQSAEATARSTGQSSANSVGQVRTWLDINQVEIQNGRSTLINRRLEQILEVLK